MCDIYDVLESSYGSADEIVSTVSEQIDPIGEEITDGNT